MDIKEKRKHNLELIRLAQNGDKKAAEELMINNEAFINHVLNPICRRNSYLYDDLFQQGRFGLYKAIMTFNLDGNIHFTTYAAVCIKNEAKMLLRKEKKYVQVTSLETEVCKDDKNVKLKDTLADPKALSEMIKDDSFCTLLKSIAKKHLSSTNFLVLQNRLFDEEPLSQRETALKLGVTRSNISKKEKFALEILKAAVLEEFSLSGKECFMQFAKGLMPVQPKNRFMTDVLSDENKIQIVKSIMPTILPVRQTNIINSRYFTIPPKTRIEVAQDEGIIFEQVYRQEQLALTKLERKINFNEIT